MSRSKYRTLREARAAKAKPAKVATIRKRKPGEKQDLLGAGDVAKLLGVERTRVARYARQGHLPEPWQHTVATKLWLRTEIEEFKKRREREGL